MPTTPVISDPRCGWCSERLSRHSGEGHQFSDNRFDCVATTGTYGDECGASRASHEFDAHQFDHEYVASTAEQIERVALGLDPSPESAPDPVTLECSPNCPECRQAATTMQNLEQERLRLEREQRRVRVSTLRANREHKAEVAADNDGVTKHPRDGIGCQCESCKLRRGEVSKLHGAMIHAASGAPRGGWVPRGDGNIFFGVELETQRLQTPDQARHVNNEIAASMGMPDDGFWFAKSDGSVTGPEFCSQPASLDVWKAYEGDLNEMFRWLIHSGYRSHQGGAAGMHVSFSKESIDDKEHLNRLLLLLHRSPNWAITMAQRTKAQCERWSKFAYASSYMRKLYCEQAMDLDVPLGDRYVALNHPGSSRGVTPGAGRFEFRLPRGTLRLERFYKNIEWIASMIEYTRSDPKHHSPRQYVGWALDNRNVYPNLAAFIEEKSINNFRFRVAQGTEPDPY